MKNRAVIKRRGTHIRQISCKTLFIAKSPFIAKTLFLKKRCFSFSWEKSKTIIRKKGRFAEKGMAFQKRSFLMTDVFQIGVAHCRRFQKRPFSLKSVFFAAKGKGFFRIRAEARTFILRNPMIKQTTKRAHAFHISKDMTAFRLRL